jgi:hypothetical protein
MPGGPGTGRSKIISKVSSGQPARSLSPDKSTATSEDLQARIAIRAYQIYEDRGREPGHDVSDWLQAEQEIMSERMDSDFG